MVSPLGPNCCICFMLPYRDAMPAAIITKVGLICPFLNWCEINYFSPDLMTPLFNSSCPIEPLPFIAGAGVSISILRLDLLHAIVSGNKWFKLKYYLAEAVAGEKTVLTFGGAYSNHIVATAAAAKVAGVRCLGVIRGEEGPTQSPT